MWVLFTNRVPYTEVSVHVKKDTNQDCVLPKPRKEKPRKAGKYGRNHMEDKEDGFSFRLCVDHQARPLVKGGGVKPSKGGRSRGKEIEIEFLDSPRNPFCHHL